MNVEPEEVTVKLITAACVPARQVRLVRARVEGADDESVTLLQPATQLKERGLVIEEATLAPDDERIVAIPIQNYSCEPLCLEPAVTVVFDPTPLVEDAIAFENVFDGNKRVRCDSGECVGSGGVAVAAVIGEDDNASGVSREARLLQDVHVDDKLTPQESGQLSDLIAEFSDVFALDQCEVPGLAQ